MTKQLNFVKEYVSPYILTLLRESESERIDRWRKTYDLPVRRNKAKAKAKNKTNRAKRNESRHNKKTLNDYARKTVHLCRQIQADTFSQNNKNKSK